MLTVAQIPREAAGPVIEKGAEISQKKAVCCKSCHQQQSRQVEGLTCIQAQAVHRRPVRWRRRLQELSTLTCGTLQVPGAPNCCCPQVGPLGWGPCSGNGHCPRLSWLQLLPGGRENKAGTTKAAPLGPLCTT